MPFYFTLQLITLMSQFNIFTIETKVEENNRQIESLRRTVKKIKENSEQVQVHSIERVNKVALVSVCIPNTSDYLVKLGKQYFAKVKSKTAIEIIEGRLKNLEQENKKWKGLNNKMSQQVEKRNKQMEQDQKRGHQIQRSIEVIGENEDGEQVFNIMEFEENINWKQGSGQMDLPVISQKQQIMLEKGQQREKRTDKPVHQVEKTENKSDEFETKKGVKFEENIKTEEEKPKKVSKFKSQRLQMKERS